MLINQHQFVYLEAKVSPGRVTTGVPVHSTSMEVVCPLQSGVSKHTSANWPRRTCSSLAATLENIARSGEMPTKTNPKIQFQNFPKESYIPKNFPKICKISKKFANINIITHPYLPLSS